MAEAMRHRAVFLAVVTVSALLPFMVPQFALTILIEALIFTLFAMSLDLMVGYCKLLPLWLMTYTPTVIWLVVALLWPAKRISKSGHAIPVILRNEVKWPQLHGLRLKRN